MAPNGQRNTPRPPQRKPAKQPRRRPAGYYDEDDMVDYDYERSARFANRGCLIVFTALFLAVAGVLLGVFIYVLGEVDGKHSTVTGPVEVVVPSGSGGQTVAGLLKDAGLIGNESVFRFYVRFNGAGAGFQKGTFTLEPGMSYTDMIAVMSEAPPAREVVTVTFPEGSTVRQFGARLEEAGICTADEFVEAANTGDFSSIDFFSRINFDPNTYMRAEGYLYPDTYEFYTDDTAYNVAYKLFNQFNTNINTEGKIALDFYGRLETQGISLRDVVTLASIVEEECSDPAEQPAVAGVFWNRMTKDLPADLTRRTLGSDATQRYLQDWVSRGYGSGPEDFVDITLEAGREKLLSIMPEAAFYAYYTGDGDPNTHDGLTAGPISSPGKNALVAALYPTDHNYFYFLSDDYGDYYYARTYNEHQANIEKMWAANARFAEEEANGGGEGDG